MLTVAVIAQKGGVGKTTLALHLGVEAAKGGPVVIIDTDPQSSAAAAKPNSLRSSPARRAGSRYRSRRPSAAELASPSSAPRPRWRAQHWPPCEPPTSA
jgi:CobQ/CobB/MinD/ParA nucleotide binding domain